MPHSEQLDELAAALVKFQRDMPNVGKSRTADTGTFRYKYADLADVAKAVHPVLAEHGLAFYTLPGPDGLEGWLLHISGQYVSAVLPIQGATPQQVGSSLTYMRRYLLGCMTGVVTDDDDDGKAAQGAPPKRPARPPVAPPIATEEHPAPDGSVDVPLPEPEAEPRFTESGARRRMFVALKEVIPAAADREDRLAITAQMAGRGSLSSSTELTTREVMIVVGVCEAIKAGVAAIVRRDGAWHVVRYDTETGAER